ncbi:MAG: sigma-70 family RNA polymerase sigma factor [Solirubrobacterales bacterium]|nr:sigma-70 family RNA polymerase sigma factor [Solirubrobacterales bacterium]
MGELYGLLARRLEEAVRIDVRASNALIEDACQIAWIRLLRDRDQVHRETVMTWLVRTAVHEAFKLLRRDRRELSLEAAAEEAMPIARSPEATPLELCERGERLAALGRLPERQQRALWLHAFGLSYTEIARHEGCTTRTVERQLIRAREHIRGIQAQAA